MRLEERALGFATEAHTGQVRRYTGEPYIVHPIAVAALVRSVPHTEAMIAAAYLHDVVEDTPVALEEIEREFGAQVRDLVFWLTDRSRPNDGNRAARKAIDRAHIAAAPAEAKTIKLADLIDNTQSIRAHDPHFWRTYRTEKCLLLGEALSGGDPSLWTRAAQEVSPLLAG